MWCFDSEYTRLTFFQTFSSSVAFDLLEIRDEFDQNTKTWELMKVQVLLQRTFAFLIELHY